MLGGSCPQPHIPLLCCPWGTFPRVPEVPADCGACGGPVGLAGLCGG